MGKIKIVKKFGLSASLALALVAVPVVAHADETSDALLESALEVIDIDEVADDLLLELTPLVEEAVLLEVVDPEIVELVEVGDTIEIAELVEENLEDQKTVWEFAGDTWSGAYTDVAGLYEECRLSADDPDCLSVLGAQMALTVADSITEPEFELAVSPQLQERLDFRVAQYYDKLEQRVAKATAKLEALDPADPNYSEQVAKTLENLDDKVQKLEARLADRAEKLTEKAEKQASKAEEEAVKQAEKEVKEAEKAAEKEAKEAEKTAEKEAKEAEKEAKRNNDD